LAVEALQQQLETYAEEVAAILYSVPLPLLAVAVEGLNLIALLQTRTELLAALVAEQPQVIQVIQQAGQATRRAYRQAKAIMVETLLLDRHLRLTIVVAVEVLAVQALMELQAHAKPETAALAQPQAFLGRALPMPLVAVAAVIKVRHGILLPELPPLAAEQTGLLAEHNHPMQPLILVAVAAALDMAPAIRLVAVKAAPASSSSSTR
jgi:hypothetical protein